MTAMHPLREWRKSRKMTLDDMSEALGVRSSHLSYVERGERGVSIELAARIAELTENAVPMDAFRRRGSAK